MTVTHVKSTEEYKKLIANDSKLVVVDFFATWCGPCKRISPYIEQLAKELENVVFLKVDVDELEEVAKMEEISAMPTFYFYKGGKRVADLVGADQTKLKSLIDTHK